MLHKKIKVLFCLNWKWAWKYYTKKMKYTCGFFISRIRKKNFWTINIDGTKIKISFHHPYHYLFGKGLYNGRHERVFLSLWKKQAENAGESLILDLGAYNGIYGLIAAKVNPSAHVVLVDIDEVNIAHMKRNILLNELGNVSIIHGAIGEKSDVSFFKQHSGGTAGHVSLEGDQIRSVTISEIAKKYSNFELKLIKSDIVGAESGALYAAKDILQRANDLGILLEFYPKKISSHFEDSKDFWHYIDLCGLEKLFLYPRTDGVAEYYFLKKNSKDNSKR